MNYKLLIRQFNSSKFRYLAALLIAGAACLGSSPTGAYDLNGRITGDLYSLQGPEQDHLRPYFRFWGDLNAWRSPTGRAFRLHTSLRWTSDFSNKLPSDPSLFVYDLYAHIKGLPSRTDWYIGRQFVYSGVGSALLDGGRVTYRYKNKLDFNLFGGSSVSSEDPEEIRSIDDFLVFGGRLGTGAIQKTPLGVSWMMRRRDGGTSFHRIGMDATRLFRKSELFARAAYNIEDVRLAELMGRAIYRPGLWYFSGEYFWREPVVASNSIFAVIDFSQYQTGRIEARRRVWRQMSILTQVQATFMDGEETWRGRLGFLTSRYSLSWIHQTGYAGDNDGLTGYVNQPLSPRLDCYVNANLFRYRVQLEQTDRSDAYATTFGFRWRAGGGFAIRAEGQFLRNAVMQDDWRYLLRISKNFSISSGGGREESR